MQFHTYFYLISLLKTHKARYKLVTNKASDQSDRRSKLRGNNPAQGMKAIVLLIKGGEKGKRNIMAVIPGNKRLNVRTILAFVGAQKDRFAAPDESTQLTGCVMGAIPPLAFRHELPIVIDESFKNWG